VESPTHLDNERKSPRVSIIICTRNRADALRETLEAIGRINLPVDLPTEVIVVDNGSTDHTAEVVRGCRLKRFPVRYVYEGRAGKSSAHNRGMQEARGDIFLFTDDDVRPADNWIEAMCRPIAEGRADLVSGRVSLDAKLERPWMQELHRSLLCTMDTATLEDAMVGANMAFSRRVLERVPEFDVELGPGALGSAEETLFHLQAKKAGFRTAVGDHQGVVEHHPDASKLTREAFQHAAKFRGRSWAYVAYHWRHQSISLTRLRFLKHLILLFVARAFRRWRWSQRDGIDPIEFLGLNWVSFYRHLFKLRGTARKYTREGLVKLDRAGQQDR
jgi:glycosyltransferase involved in cell wall biosynthesis